LLVLLRQHQHVGLHRAGSLISPVQLENAQGA
jgi:hypothetical protein